MDQIDPHTLLAWILDLPPERLAEVADFVEFLRAREAEFKLSRAVATASERSLAAVWDNPEDAIYDAV